MFYALTYVAPYTAQLFIDLYVLFYRAFNLHVFEH